ncbi:MAG TPA: TetR/AcrR family transcriptional regulator [Methanocella sp.]|jgi:AcrR family transcriptional regulator
MAVKRKTGRPVKVEGEKSTKEKIFDAAVELFAERGYDGVSIRDIAKAVGIRESSVYKHYESKDEILDSIFEYLKSRLYAAPAPGMSMDALLERMSFEQVLELGFASLKGMVADPSMVRMVRIITIELHHNAKIREFFLNEMFERPIRENELMFRRLMDQGKIRRLDPRALATAYFAFSAYLHSETFILRYEEGLDMERMEQKSLANMRLFVEMIKPEGN